MDMTSPATLGIGTLATVLIIFLCVMVFNTLIRTYKIGKIHERTSKLTGIISSQDMKSSNATQAAL